MARARKSHADDEENTKSRLEPAYGPVGDNRYVIYCDYPRPDEKYPRVLILNFKATYAAKSFIDKLIHHDTWEWVKKPPYFKQQLKTSSGILISMFGKDLETLMEYELSALEQEWSHDFVSNAILNFKYGSSEERKHDNDDNEEIDLTEHSKPQAAFKSKREKIIREPKVRVDTSNMVSANDIAKELKVEGREVRGVLRGMKLEKPAHGWAWPKDEAVKLKAKIVEGLKEAKKGKKK